MSLGSCTSHSSLCEEFSGKGIYRNHSHLDIVACSDADYAGSRSNQRFTIDYCTFIGGNLVSWRSKLQNVVSRSSAEAEYRTMTHTTRK